MSRSLRSSWFVALLLVVIGLTSFSRAASAKRPPMDTATPADYGAEARLLWRTVGCGGQDAIPERLPQKTIESHCKEMQRLYTKFRTKWVDVAKPLLSALRPANLPPTVVYPFGGGDLFFTMVVFPDATEITSISLERAGNARVIDTVSKADFRAGLVDATWMIHRLIGHDYSFTEHMETMQQSKLPVQLSMVLAALAALDYEPVSLRYFDILADGSLHYYSEDELDAGAGGREKGKPHDVDAGIPAVYGNIELTFRPIGQPNAPVRTYRSIAGNLHDSRLTADSPLYKHLAQKGPIAAMTKAASYLLWRDDFSHIRDFLLGHMVWMLSDSTGILPMHAAAAGFLQETYGRFRGSLLGTDHKRNKDMIRLWHDQPTRALPFKFGYPDYEKKDGHLLVTRKQ